MSCPHAARIQAYTMKALPEDQMEEMRLHLAQCEDCRRLADDFGEADMDPAGDEEVQALWTRIAPAMEAERRAAGPPWWRMWAWIAAPVAAALLLVLLVPRSDPRPESAAIPLPEKDISVMARLEPAPLELPLDDLLITRGAGQPALSPQLTSAFQQYQRGEYAAAAEALHALESRHGARFEVFFYQGVSFLLGGRAGEAVAPLQRARQLGAPDREHLVRWYLAQTYLRLRQAGPAREELRAVCQSTGDVRSGLACQQLGQLDEPGK
jgi:hypothetical protein